MVFNIVKQKNFRKFFFSDIISGFGTGMTFIGINWFVLEQTGSSKSVGLILALNILAGLLISPFVGPITDKFNRKLVILGTFFIRALAAIIVLLLISFTEMRVEFMYILAVASGIGWTTYWSASRSFVQEIVSGEDFIKGNSLMEISLQVGMFVAGGLTGILYKYFGFDIILIINASTFIISSIILIQLKYKPIEVIDKSELFHKNFINGYKYLKERPYIFLIGLLSIIPLVATMLLNVVLPGYVNKSVNGDASVFGIADMCYGIGGLISGFVAAPLAKRLNNKNVVKLMYVSSIIALVSLILNKYIILLYLLIILFGLSNSSLRIVMNTILMEVVSKSFMGRAMAVWMSFSLLIQMLSTFSLGILIDKYSPRYGFMWMSIVMVMGLLFSIVLLSREKIQLNDKKFKTEDA